MTVQDKALSLSNAYKSAQQSHSNQQTAPVVSRPGAAPAIHCLRDLLAAGTAATFGSGCIAETCLLGPGLCLPRQQQHLQSTE